MIRPAARFARIFAELGVVADGLAPEVWTPAPFGQRALDVDALAPWLGARAVEERTLVLPHGVDPLAARLRDGMLRAFAAVDPAEAIRQAAATPGVGPLEHTLRLGTLAQMSALVAANAPDADAAIARCAEVLAAPRPVARIAALRLGEIGITAGPLGRRARASLEDALTVALEAAHDLGASGELASQLDASLAELALPGMSERVAAATGRIVDLVGVLGALAAHRQGLAQRLEELAPRAPAFAAPAYVVAYLAALGSADPGPYLAEVCAHLERAAMDRDPTVRALALEALGPMAREVPAFVELLVSALTDGLVTSRTAAALAIAEAGFVPDAAARELVDMVSLGEGEEALAAARALARCGRGVPDSALGGIDDPVIAASAGLLLAGADADDALFAKALEAHAAADPDDYAAFDASLQPMSILVEALRAMPLSRSATWLSRFAAAEVPAAGEVCYRALDGCESIPPELADAGAPLREVLAHGEEDDAALAALVAARLWPDDPALEPLILERTELPVTLVALAALDRITESTCEDLLTLLEDPTQEYAALAIDALGRCELAAARASTVASALASHVRDDDPLAESAHGALLELVERHALTA